MPLVGYPISQRKNTIENFASTINPSTIPQLSLNQLVPLIQSWNTPQQLNQATYLTKTQIDDLTLIPLRAAAHTALHSA